MSEIDKCSFHYSFTKKIGLYLQCRVTCIAQKIVRTLALPGPETAAQSSWCWHSLSECCQLSCSISPSDFLETCLKKLADWWPHGFCGHRRFEWVLLPVSNSLCNLCDSLQLTTTPFSLPLSDAMECDEPSNRFHDAALNSAPVCSLLSLEIGSIPWS